MSEHMMSMMDKQARVRCRAEQYKAQGTLLKGLAIGGSAVIALTALAALCEFGNLEVACRLCQVLGGCAAFFSVGWALGRITK